MPRRDTGEVHPRQVPGSEVEEAYYIPTINTVQGKHGEYLELRNEVDDFGRPKGGTAEGTGLEVSYQAGPIGEGGRNGAFIEDLLMAAVDRLDFYQGGVFACRENAIAKTKIEEALHWLDHRTENRKRRGVEGTQRV